jgi:signal transduction histidine kinase/ActR/RegA family two-component response regulator
MTADSYPFPTWPAPLRFAIALAAVAAVFAVDRTWAVVDDGSHFLLLGTAVMGTAWIAGTGPALAATVLGAVLGAYTSDGDVGTSAASMHLALFVVQGLLLTALVSELRRARRAAEQQVSVAEGARREGEVANRLKDEFLATVSHELRTPLNAVLGWVYLLRTGKLDAATSARGLESLDRNIRLQAQLTSDLLDVSKALTGKLRVASRPALLNDAVRQAVGSLQSAARARAVQVRARLPDAPVVVLGDPTRLRQIAWQLLSNAIKFTPRGGTVEITVEERHDEAQITVRDSGKGIDPAFLPRVFDRFTQADASTTRVTGGLGVGLALVRELVEIQGGDVEAQNRQDATGSIFRVRFPLHEADVSEVRVHLPVAAAIQASPPLDGLRVLVLDQDREGRELLRAILQQRGAAVRTVSTVGDALEALESWRPDVLVSDGCSPEHDSYALIGKVHSLESDKGGRIPALALTNAARTDQRLKQLLESAQSELTKPVEPSALTAEIARLTGRERRRVRREEPSA